jgi:hypothetical protein
MRERLNRVTRLLNGVWDMEVQKCPLTHEEKNTMIAEAAYLRSEKRGHAGDPVEDWLAAESDLEDALAEFCRSGRHEHDLSAYQRLRKEVRRILERAEESVSADTIRQALTKAAAELRQAGEFFPETIDRAAKAVKEEIAGSIEKLGHDWGTFRIKQSELFANWKEKGTHALNQKTKAINELFSRWRSKDGP